MIDEIERYRQIGSMKVGPRKATRPVRMKTNLAPIPQNVRRAVCGETMLPPSHTAYISR
jgi:hypothetical protein